MEKIRNNPNHLKEKCISKWNFLLNDNKPDTLFREISFLIEKSKTNYLNSKDKEKFLENALYNFVYILNNLNVKRVYNSTSILDFKEFKNLEDLKTMFRIKWTDFEENKKWMNCHTATIFIKWFVDKITNSDKNIKIIFDLNKKNNHWRILFRLKNKVLIIETTYKWFRTLEKKDYKDKEYKFYTHMPHYINNAKKNWIEKDHIIYQYGKYKISLYKKWGFIFFVFLNKPPKSKIPYGFRKIYKKTYILRHIKYVYKSGKYENIEELKKDIWKRFWEKAKLMLENINQQKLMQFL